RRLRMGNMDAQRDWGFAGDYVQAMWLTLQQPQPQDFVIATGKMHSVQELVEIAFSTAGLDWQEYVEIDPRFLRPAEVDHLCGNAALAREKLGWEPNVGFEELIRMMVESDLQLVRSQAAATIATSV
ncbi:MAG TPA: GDP-mannose 4,6-dehydratase, partial [Terriglobia bacterium]|nr:GDP-mannose 4,6-dehydratase [Terriglobia bacterium]